MSAARSRISPASSPSRGQPPEARAQVAPNGRSPLSQAVLGVIGGSGVYDLPGLEHVREERVQSPWGEPSDVLRGGRMGSTEVVFLPRHGRGHRLSPSDINYRANIDVLKRAGVTDLASLSACGPLPKGVSPAPF